MTDYLKPVKAWAFESNEGVYAMSHHAEILEAANYAQNDGKPVEIIPVIISDSRWLTRAEFEASDYRNQTFLCWLHGTDGNHKTYAVHVPARGFIDPTDDEILPRHKITHVKPIEAPDAPSAQEAE